MCNVTRTTTQNTPISCLLFQLSIHFKLPLTAARFVILPFLFLLFLFLCAMSHALHKTLPFLVYSFNFQYILSCSWLQLGLLFYVFYFTFLFLCAMSHALHNTPISCLLFPLFQLSIHFKLLLTAARFVILPFLFYFFIFMCNVTRTTQHSHFLSTLSFISTFNTF